MDAGLPQMQRRLADYRISLFREGILDSQYLQLQELEDESNPGFVVEVVTLFLTDSEKLLHDLSSDLVQQNVDFKGVDVHVDRLEGGSRRDKRVCAMVDEKALTFLVDSIGLPKLKNTCIAFRNLRSSCQEKNIPEYLRCLEQMRQEFFLVKSKLETLLDVAGATNCGCGRDGPETAILLLMAMMGNALKKIKRKKRIEATILGLSTSNY